MKTWTWIFHEMTHSQQCKAKKGRERYALMWFGQLGKTTLKLIAKGKKLSSKKIHDKMPMEKQASKNADRVYKQATKPKKRIRKK